MRGVVITRPSGGNPTSGRTDFVVLKEFDRSGIKTIRVRGHGGSDFRLVRRMTRGRGRGAGRSRHGP